MKILTKLICLFMLLWLNQGSANAQCKAAFTFSRDTIKTKDIQFANNSTGSQLSYHWNFGDGTTSDIQSPNHTYASFGAYNVCLYTYSKVDTTCKSTLCDSLYLFNNAPPPCQAYFYPLNDAGKTNLVHVNNNSQGKALIYTWNFGDGSPVSNDISPSHQYANIGTYSICLNIKSKTDTSCHNQYCVQITTHQVVLPNTCKAAFSLYNMDPSHFSNTISTNNFSNSGNDSRFSWDFGDGSAISHEPTPDHKYAVQGTYSICLTETSVSDSTCHDTKCESITTTDGTSSCKANFSVMRDSVNTRKIHVKNFSTGNNLQYLWSFNDGSTSTSFEPVHEFTFNGTYGVYLTVTSSTDTNCHSKRTDSLYYNPAPAPCKAYFYAHNDSVNHKLVHFSNYSSGSSLNYAWNFNDGTNLSKDMNPNHTFTINGTYNVCLTISSATDTSCHNTYCSNVTVKDSVTPPPAPCKAYFYAYNDSINLNKVYFTNHSTGNALQYVWNFGDGKLSHDISPSHEYAVKGAYTVCLAVTSSSDTSCHSSYCMVVKVRTATASCKANFYTYVSASNLNKVYVKNISTGVNLSYSWNFGDGSTSTNFDPSHIYTQSGTYNICLTISNSNGCSNTKCASVTVGSCKAGFYLYKDSLNSHQYYAINTSWGHNIHYTWSFGDGAISHDEFPSHVYQNFGKYYVCVSVNDSLGCNDQFCDSISVTAKTNGQIGFNILPPPTVVTGISNTNATLSNVSIYPNPVAEVANINISSINNEEIKVNIANVLGQITATKTYKINKGDNTIQLDVADLAQGIYYITISSANSQQLSMKFVK
jgi:PKD repeat protein